MTDRGMAGVATTAEMCEVVREACRVMQPDDDVAAINTAAALFNDAKAAWEDEYTDAREIIKGLILFYIFSVGFLCLLFPL